MTILENRLALLDTITLEHGSHNPNSKFCAMELVAYLADEPWTDQPKCVSPVIAAFLRNWNDNLVDTDRQMLKPLLPLTIGTATGKRDDETRAWMAIDWLAREYAPAFLRLAGLTSQGEALESLAALTGSREAKAAQPVLNAAKKEAAAAADASGAASGDAACAASAAVSGDAAWDASEAAWAAAGAAVWAAAAWAALAPTVKTLQTSGYQLVERMCAVGRETA